MPKPRIPIAWPEFLALLGLMVAVWFLWDTPFIYPLKILVVFFHELSHGLVAWITGGRIVEIRLTADQGGLCVTQGGNRFLTLSAGYLGSLLCGGIILLAAARTSRDRALSIAIGALTLFVALFWIRPLFQFGFNFAAGTGAALILVGIFLPLKINDLFNKTIGLTSCLYAVMDIKSDILDRPGLKSDATMLADATGIPSLLWGLAWITLASLAALFFLALATRQSSPPTPNTTPQFLAPPTTPNPLEGPRNQ